MRDQSDVSGKEKLFWVLIRDPEDNKSVHLESERVDFDFQSTFTVL